MSDRKSIFVLAVEISEQAKEGCINRHGLSDTKSYIEDIEKAAFFQSECREYCQFPTETSSSYLPNNDYTYLNVRFPVVVGEDELFSDEIGRMESACGLKSSVEQFGVLLRAAAAILAQAPVIDCDLDTLDQARSLATRIQHNFESLLHHEFIVYFGDAKEPMIFTISPETVPELSARVLTVYGTVMSYLSETQVYSNFCLENNGLDIRVEGAMEHSALFKEALKTGEIIRLTIQPYGDSEEYAGARIVSAEKTRRFSGSCLFNREEMEVATSSM
jgi:hypothetical protein